VRGGVLPHEALQLLCGQRCAEVVTLRLVTTLFMQKGQLAFGFHALGGGAHPQRLRHADDGADDGAVIAVVAQVAHKGLIDLQLEDLEPLELAG